MLFHDIANFFLLKIAAVGKDSCLIPKKWGLFSHFPPLCLVFYK